MTLLKAHIMFKCFFHLVNAKEESCDLKSIILVVKKKKTTAFLRSSTPFTLNSVHINRCGCVS